jgi:hypothetical protein
MARSNERPGRRSAREDERSQAEPVVSFTPRDEFAEDSEPSLSGAATAPRAKPRAQAATAKDQEPRVARAPASKPAVAGVDRPLFLYMPPPRRRPGVLAAKSIAVVGILALIGVYAWHRYAPVIGETPSTAEDVLPALAQPQPLSSTTYGAPNQSSLPTQDVAPAPVAQTPHPPTPSAPTPQPSPPAAAANPPPQPVASAPPPAPTQVVNPAPKPVASTPAPQAPVAAAPPLAPPKHDTVKRKTPRNDASLDQSTPRDRAALPPTPPAPAQANVAPPPPAAAAPIATGRPRPLNQSAPPPQREAALPPQAPPSSSAPDNGPATGPNTVSVDGVTYVNGQEPRALGTVGDANAPAANTAAPPAFAPAQPTAADTMRPYVPRETNNDVTPLPNDVIILPNGQMAVPSAQQ